MKKSLVKLKNCCEIVSGSTPSRSIAEYWNGDIPWATPKDISRTKAKLLVEPEEYITRKGLDSCSTRLVPKGSILFSSRAPIGLVAVAGVDICTNQGFKNLVPSNNVYSDYLYHCMAYFAPDLALLGNGATFKEVSKEIVGNFQIPLPPLEEQRRIAAILDKADAMRRKRQESLKLADDLVKSQFIVTAPVYMGVAE
jgi:type I restriction enzyme S subunit